jgi:hypothetical protein
VIGRKKERESERARNTVECIVEKKGDEEEEGKLKQKIKE